MNIKLLWLMFVFASAAAVQAGSLDSGSPPAPPKLIPVQQQSQAAHLAAELLTRYHYKAMPLDDAMSEKIYDHYLKALDSQKLFLVQADIDQLAGIRTKLSDAIMAEDLTVPFAFFTLYAQRVFERYSYARTLLTEGFDFRQQESYQYERSKEAWPKSELEMRELWRKRVKNHWLRLKLAGKDDKNIIETLDRRYVNSLKQIGRVTGEDAFQTFMNAYTMAIEPHTNYLGRLAAEDFDIALRLSVVGIGAVLAKKDDYTTIRELVPGGPAALSGQLRIGDRILGVAQGENKVVTNVLGWRLDDTVALMNGEADSAVLLDILPADAGTDGKHHLVSLIRKKITLEEQSAKKYVLSVTDGNTTRHIGVITIPAFYQDVEARQKGDQTFKSATRDVARLLAELKKDKVDSVLIDLRDNGGGFLTEAIELTSLFIDKGPVVQQRDARGEVTVACNTRAGVAWDGPLGVLINRGSASASEIFAAAIQDYGRGLLIGETSFGKGTVQTMIDLDQVAKNDKQKFGELKLTFAQFFRINGDSTQLRGVTPDILFPTASDPESLGEASLDNPLPWVQVKPTDYSPSGDLKYLLPSLLTRHEGRLKSEEDLRYLQEDIAEFKLQRRRNLVSLNEAERRKERDEREARLVSREKPSDARKSSHVDHLGKEPTSRRRAELQDDGLQADERNVANEFEHEQARQHANNVLVDEAVHILSDELGLMKPRARLAAQATEVCAN